MIIRESALIFDVSGYNFVEKSTTLVIKEQRPSERARERDHNVVVLFSAKK